MSHSILNVVRHQGRSFRLGIICREFLMVPQPSQIIINGINQNPIVFPVDNYYSIHGSIAHPEIRAWLETHFPREADDPIWLLKFEVEVQGNNHIFSYIGSSNYRKIPHQRELIDLDGNRVRYQTDEDLIRIVWGN